MPLRQTAQGERAARQQQGLPAKRCTQRQSSTSFFRVVTSWNQEFFRHDDFR
jgi:hypothetical protein